MGKKNAERQVPANTCSIMTPKKLISVIKFKLKIYITNVFPFR